MYKLGVEQNERDAIAPIKVLPIRETSDTSRTTTGRTIRSKKTVRPPKCRSQRTTVATSAPRTSKPASTRHPTADALDASTTIASPAGLPVEDPALGTKRPERSPARFADSRLVRSWEARRSRKHRVDAAEEWFREWILLDRSPSRRRSVAGVRVEEVKRWCFLLD